MGNPYAAGLRDVLTARGGGRCKGLGAYALGIVLKELARGRAPLPTPLGPGLDDDGDEVEEEDDARDARAALAEATETFPWNWSAWLGWLRSMPGTRRRRLFQWTRTEPPPGGH